MVSFQRPTGAAADLRELEYVSALQQTQSGAVRKDGSIQDVDMQLFLKSRYGIEVSLDDVKRLLLGGFGDDDVIDLSELAAMLLIPTCIKAAAASQEEKQISEQDSSEEEKEDSEQVSSEGILYPKPDLLQTVLDMILRDVTGSSEPPKLTISLLQDILLAYGEEEMSQDQGLLREMMDAAGEEGDDFDVNAFARALTSDVLLYNVKDEVTLTTNYHDVMNPKDPQDKTSATETDLSLANESDEDEDYSVEYGRLSRKHNSQETKQGPATIRKFWSSPAIDFTACRYSSKYIVVLLWTGFVISYIAYFQGIIRGEASYFFGDVCEGTGNYGCTIGVAIVEWLFILGTLCGFGLAYVALSSIGNGIEGGRTWARLIGATVIGCWTWLLFLVLYSRDDEKIGEFGYIDEEGNFVPTEDIIIEESEPYEAVVYFLSLIIGTVVIILQVYMMFGESIRRHCFNKETLVKLFTASGVKAEAYSKQAAALKMNSIVDNARQIHEYSGKDIEHGETSFGAGLLNFSVRGEDYEEAGGFVWTWKRMFSKDLFEKDGVWISARLLAGNFAQLLISAFLLTYGIAFTRVVVEEWQKGNADPARYLYLILEFFDVLVPARDFADSACDYVTDIANGVLNTSAILLLSADNTTCTAVAEEAINRTIDNVADSLYPQEQYMVEVPMIVATTIAFIYTLALVFVYIPSVASTTLQFRSGVIPFFRDEYNFALYRTRLDQVTILLGSMFWSAIYASVFVGAFIGFIVFLFLWQATAAFFRNLVAILIALICTISIKILVSVFLLRKVYVAFYRKRVNQANIASLALECIMVGFAVGTALGRALKIVLISILYIGRIDTPLLAPGVGYGPLMDRYPFIFRQDILALEAHRHPFVDLVGKIYLLKLRYGERFANRAGYAFRLMFTVALLPWVRKYRVIARPEIGSSDDNSPTEGSALRRATLLPRSSILAQSVNRASVMTTRFVDSAVVMAESIDSHGEMEAEFKRSH